MDGGLANVGNTCGLNAIVQCLYHVPCFREWAAGREAEEAEATDEAQAAPRMLDELVRLFSDKTRHAEALRPARFTRAFQRRMRGVFDAGEQMDMAEVWTMLADAMEGDSRAVRAMRLPWAASGAADAALQAMARQATAAWARAMGGVDPDYAALTTGLQVGQVVCATCNHVYHNFETFTTVPLEIKESASSVGLSSCVDAYLAPERLNADGGEWRCDHCKTHEPAEKLTRFWRAPRMLVFVLKRFRPGARGYEKINTPVDIPRRMDFMPGTELSEMAGGAAYKLKSIGCHFGTLERGHCTAMCVGDDGNWRHFDDLHVHALPADRVLQNNAHAYLLFYERG